MRRDDPRVDEARNMPPREVALRLGDRLGVLREEGNELIGPCPICGGTKRFNFNVNTGVFICRSCPKGGDKIELVMWVMNLSFMDAVTFLVGEADPNLDPAEVERRRKKHQDEQERQARYSEQRRKRSIQDAQAIWAASRPIEGTPVIKYLARRGISGAIDHLTPCLRYHPNLAYMVKQGRDWVELHRGPAMIAGVLSPEKRLTAVHRTWLDLGQPGGKAVLIDPKYGETKLPSKKVWGSKQGGAIRLIDPHGATVMVMGEGIETTLSAFVSATDEFKGAAFWAGVDLGNMAGPMLKVKGQRYSGKPDMNQDKKSFLPPPWIKRLVYLLDGDSDPKMTRAKVECGLKRAMAFRPDLRAEIIPAETGLDLNDMLLGKSGQQQNQQEQEDE